MSLTSCTCSDEIPPDGSRAQQKKVADLFETLQVGKQMRKEKKNGIFYHIFCTTFIFFYFFAYNLVYNLGVKYIKII